MGEMLLAEKRTDLTFNQGITNVRADIIPRLLANDDCTKLMDNLSRVICDINLKYKIIDVEKLIRSNSQDLEQLKRIGLALNILEKYARHLLKPIKERSNMWRYVKFNNQFFRERVDVVKGGRDIMRKMGYTVEIEGGLAFPDNSDSEPNVLAHLVCDIALLKYELTNLLNGLHPAPEIIVDLLPLETQNELQVVQSIMDFKRKNRKTMSEDQHKSFVVPLVNPPRVVPAKIGVMEESGAMPSESNLQGSNAGPPNVQHVTSDPPTQNSTVPGIPTLVNQVFDSTSTEISGQVSKTPSGEETSSASGPKEDDQTYASVVCDICGDHTPELVCNKCDNKQLCQNCDQRWHQHPKRKNHERQHIQPSMNPNAASAGTSGPGQVVGYTVPQAPFTQLSPTMSTKTMSQTGLPPTKESNVGVVAPLPSATSAKNAELDTIRTRDQLGVASPPQLVVTETQETNVKATADTGHTGYTITPQAESRVKHKEPTLDSHSMAGLASEIPPAPSSPVKKSSSLPQVNKPPSLPNSRLLRRIMEIKDPERRESKIAIDLEMLEQGIQEAEEESSKLIDNGADFEDDEYKSIMRRKYNLKREKSEIERYRKENFPELQENLNDDISNQPVYRPPMQGQVPYSVSGPRIAPSIGAPVSSNVIGNNGSSFGPVYHQGVSMSSAGMSYMYDPHQTPQFHAMGPSSVPSTGPGHQFKPAPGPNVTTQNTNLAHQYTPLTGPYLMGQNAVPRHLYTPVIRQGLSASQGILPPTTGNYMSMGMQNLIRMPSSPQGLLNGIPPHHQGQVGNQSYQLGHVTGQGHVEDQSKGYSIAYPPGDSSSVGRDVQLSRPLGLPIGVAAPPPHFMLDSSNIEKKSPKRSMEKSRIGLDQMEKLPHTENAINEALSKENQESNIPFKLQKVHYPPTIISPQLSKPPLSEVSGALLNKSILKERDHSPSRSTSTQDMKHDNINSTLLNRPIQREGRPNQARKTKNSSLPTQSSQAALGAAVGMARSKSETPYRKWVCEHCTYHNSPDTRICEMCSKTSQNPTYVGDTQATGYTENSAASPYTPSPGDVLEDEDETEVLEQASQVGQRAYDFYKKVEDEKKLAHEKFQEKLRQEAEAAAKSREPTKTPVSQLDYTPVIEPLNVAKLQGSGDQSSLGRQQEVKSLEKPQVEFSSISPPMSFVSGGSNGNLRKMKELNQRRIQEAQFQEGRNMIRMLREAENSGYEMEEIEIAFAKCDKNYSKVLEWLKNDWEMSVDTLITLVTNAGTNMEQNQIGELSSPEARKALRKTKGELDSAVAVCIANRKEMYKEITSRGNFAREAILVAMLHNKGDIEATLDELNLSSIQPYYDRIWAENENIHVSAEALARQADIHDACVSVTNSILGHHDFLVTVSDTNVDINRRIRMILVEGKLQSWGRAETVIKILDVDVASKSLDTSLEDIVEAVKNCGDRNSSLVYLNQDCQICMGKFAMSKIRSLGSCECKICVECVRGYFEVTIREKHVRNLCCPLCGKPDMEDAESATNYLTFLTMLLQTIVSPEDLQLYDSKLRDWNLQKDPHFRWCAHCGNGFIWDRANVMGMVCPHCRKKTCYLCKKQWEDQHEGISCEEFEQWKIDNDPDNQAMGLAKHLQINGIECPSCKMRYALAKGGCMHFICPQCGHEFCSGCSQSFVKQGPCAGYRKCHGKGLHCHHPRDCFYYLRDNSVEELQKILKDKKLAFNTEAPNIQDNNGHCPVMEQKEMGSHMADEPCGKELVQGHAGLCLIHYKEYLVNILNKNKADPVNILSLDEMKRLLEREEKNVPNMRDGERDSQYRRRLASYIKEKIPIKRDRQHPQQ